MKRYRALSLFAICLSLFRGTFAQTPTETASALPRLVRFGGAVKDLGGSPLSGVVGITFALYSEQTGGAALWQETQNITADSNGRYTALLGATKTEGLPATLFINEQAHWVGVQIEGQAEQPRVLLVSSPYALKAGDAETIGGLPPSAFVLAAPAAVSVASPLNTPSRSAASPADAPDVGSVTGAGTTDYIPRWTSASNIGKSVLYQTGTGATAEVGINTTTPASTLDVNGGATVRGTLGLPATGTATAGAGQDSEKLNLQASVFNGTVSTAVAQTFQIKAEPVGNNTPAASGVLSLLYGSGMGGPSETGLSIASNGVITFAPGQTFPGSGGTITGVTAGTDLTGGGTTGTVTLNVDTSKVPQLAIANTFTASQAVNGTVSATSFSGNGSALTNLQGSNVQGTVATASNALGLGGLAPSAYQPAGSYATTGTNTFSGSQNVTGNVAATGSVSGVAATFTGLVTEAGALLPASGTATATQGYNSQPLDSMASAYSTGTASAQSQDFRWLAEPVGSGTSSPSGKLDLLFGANGATPAETGLSVASSGMITFVAGQPFPGAGGGGTVTSVGSGAGLTGGPITSTGSLSIAAGGVSNAMLANSSLTVAAGTDLTVTGGGSGLVTLGGSTTLNLDTTKVPQLNASNTFGAGQTVNGTVTGTQFVSTVATGSAPLVVNSTTQVNNLNASFVGGLQAASFQPAGTYATLGSNTFSATQFISSGDLSVSNGNVDMPSTTTSGTGVINVGGNPFVHACCDESNAFIGVSAGNFAGSGTANTGVGFAALRANGGTYNTATGAYALENNTTASGNTADGYAALVTNTTGTQDTAVGYQALADNSGSTNTAVGYYALRNNTSGSNNIGIGNYAGANVTATSNNIYIGNQGSAGDNNVIRIGTGTLASTYVAGISTSNISGFEVLVNSSGQLGIATSSRRYKEDIQNMGEASSGLLRLRPVTFRYKKPFSDGSQPIQYGLIAEEVAEVYPELVARSTDGQIESVKYQVLGPMLLNELQKQNATIAAQKEQIQTQEQQIQSLEGRLARVEAALHQISALAPSR